MGELYGASGIYSLTNTENGKRYIGRSTNLEKRKNTHFWRLRTHTHPNNHLQRAYNEGQRFDFEVLEYCAVDALNDREIYWIAYYNTFSANGYNQCKGGASVLGRKLSAEGRAKISQKNSGRKMSPESIKKRGAARAEHLKDPKFREEYLKKVRSHPSNNPWKGKHLSEEHRKHIGESLKGRFVSQKHKDKLRELYSGEKSITAKLTIDEVVEMRLRFFNGEKRMSIAKSYPQISPQTIYDAITGRRWKCVPTTIEELEAMYEKREHRQQTDKDDLLLVPNT